jgi:hypothetical protein
MKKMFASLALVLALFGFLGLSHAVAGVKEGNAEEKATLGGPATIVPDTFGRYDPATGDLTSPYPPYHRPDK